MNVWIEKVSDDLFMVRWDLNGYMDLVRCESEEQARTWADGFVRGMNAVKNLIGNGPRLDVDVRAVSLRDAQS